MDADARSGSGRRSGGYAKGAARRAYIVEVATSFFGRVGYRAATMLQIAQACGISRAGLLHHFPTKESLLEAVLAERDRTDQSRTVRPADTGTGVAALADLVHLAEHNATIPNIVNLYAVLSAEAGDPAHPAHGYFVTRYEHSRAMIAKALTEIDGQGLLAPGADPTSLAIELIALMDGLQVQWLLAPDQINMAVQMRQRIEAALTAPLPLEPPSG